MRQTQFATSIEPKYVECQFSHDAQIGCSLAQVDGAGTRPNMGLATWKSAGVQKADVSIAKNYLAEPEINELNRVVVMWLDFAEDQARRRKEIFLKDWEEKLDAFLKFNDRDVLPNAGNVSRKQADAHAEEEYAQFAARRRALLEAEGAEHNVKMLEQAAQALPKTKRKRID